MILNFFLFDFEVFSILIYTFFFEFFMFFIFSNIMCRYNSIFNHMACDLHLDERTAQMYISIDIASFDHVIHKNEHIKNLVTSIFRNRTFMKKRI